MYILKRYVSILLCWFSQIRCQQIQNVKGNFLGKATFSLRRQTTSAKSLIECTALCASVTPCMSFSYNNLTKECRLHPLVLNPETHGIPSPEWRYYEVFTDHCNFYEGYHNNRELNICYKVYPRKKPCSEARLVCSADNATMVSIDNARKQQFLEQLLQEIGFPVFVGGMRVDATWFYEDGRPMSYTNWNQAHDQPDNDPIQHCVGIFEVYKYFWHDVNYNEEMMIICEKPRTK